MWEGGGSARGSEGRPRGARGGSARGSEGRPRGARGGSSAAMGGGELEAAGRGVGGSAAMEGVARF